MVFGSGAFSPREAFVHFFQINRIGCFAISRRSGTN